MKRPCLMAGLLLLLSSSFGCGGLPRALDPIIATRSARYRMLGEAVQKFHTALNWGDPSAATEYVDPSALATFTNQVLGSGAGQRVTEVRVDQVDFSPTDDDSATVYSTIRYYGPPSIQVRSYFGETNVALLENGWAVVVRLSRKAPIRETDPLGGFK